MFFEVAVTHLIPLNFKVTSTTTLLLNSDKNKIEDRDERHGLLQAIKYDIHVVNWNIASVLN